MLTGKTGQIGGDLLALLSEFAEVLATDRSSLDLTRPEKIRECVASFRPDVIINAAAYTAVDKAETEPELSAAINTSAPSVLAEEAARTGALLIHYSTDYVFDGAKTEPYVESDPVNPLSVYGRTKAAGEDAIRATGCDHLIFRTSWVYSARGSNFLRTILRLASEREELRIVDDQIGAPTSSRLLATATIAVMKQELQNPASRSATSGTYHLTASGHCSWFDFANEIVGKCDRERFRVKKVLPIPTSAFPTPARRPHNSRLHCSKLGRVFNLKMPGWIDGLNDVVAQL
jgi:dTDP-4-dehydrorhamnose reductase